jgi:hypothetical protein
MAVQQDDRPVEPRPDRATEPARDGGVDVGLIRWMLGLSPEERLRAAQDMLDTVWALRDGEPPA